MKSSEPACNGWNHCTHRLLHITQTGLAKSPRALLEYREELFARCSGDGVFPEYSGHKQPSKMSREVERQLECRRLLLLAGADPMEDPSPFYGTSGLMSAVIRNAPVSGCFRLHVTTWNCS